MNLHKGSSRAVVLSAATLVATLALVTVAHAVQTITTPNAVFIRYTLASGTNSAPIVPVAGQSVFVMGCQTNINYRGVAQITLLRIAGSFLEWVGLESTAGAAITQGFSGTAGTHIVYLDYSHTVDIRVNTTDSFVVHNANPNPMAGSITLIW
jgi:hypothetical protein